METNEHRMQMVLLIQSLKEGWRSEPDFFVGGNMFVYFSEEQVKHNDFRGPDVFVVLGTSRRTRLSWVAWGEGGKLPDVVIELLSERTKHVDRGIKMRIYAEQWKTTNYFLYDPIRSTLEGYRLDPVGRAYVRLQPDARGDLDCCALGLKVGVREGVFEDREWLWLRWLDADGVPLATPQERANALEARLTEERALAEEQRALAEEQRALAEEQRALAEEQRALAEEQRALAEELAVRVRELEAKRDP